MTTIWRRITRTVSAEHISLNMAITMRYLTSRYSASFPWVTTHLKPGGGRFCRCCSNAETYSEFGKVVMPLSLNLLQSRYISSFLHSGRALDGRSVTEQYGTGSLSGSPMKMST